MSDLITAEEAQKQLDDLLSGGPFPYRDDISDAYSTVIALHAQLADAKAAQAMVVERAMPTDQAIQDLADHMWRVHPRELDEAGYVSKRFGGRYENPRAAWYADQIKALCRGASTRALAAKAPDPSDTDGPIWHERLGWDGNKEGEE